MTRRTRMPVVFIGHGNPMNALLDNAFSQKLTDLGRDIPRPEAILCVSAHWMTEGTWVTRMPKPKTIHDFYGFPKELFAVEYPAPGSPEIADLIRAEVDRPRIGADESAWGLDHGTWSVLRHMYPRADVPVLQLSLDMTLPSEAHLEIGEKLRGLRDRGILLVGSGNIVHNLRKIDFESGAKPFDWAVEFDEWVKERLELREYSALAKEATNTGIGKLSIPTPDHWYPLFYPLGASDENDRLSFEYEGIENASISMRTFTLGLR